MKDLPWKVVRSTRQQVKIVDAMAYGLPAVAYERAARTSPMRHGENGLIAATANEFLEYARRWWCDANLRERLGKASRDTMEVERVRHNHGQRLSSILEN